MNTGDLFASKGRCSLCGEIKTNEPGEVHGNVNHDGILRCYKIVNTEVRKNKPVSNGEK